ncbi:MAG: enoyl-CoA hydratase-related protein, partial [Pseudoprimorskyibacter sp.]|nr:enoyl-CoA hydratase-related protein [Pseudoprimorskyibacter sp.]
MLAHPVSADRLYQLGAITDLVARGDALDTARALAHAVSLGPEGAIATIKSLLNQAESSEFEVHLDAECAAMAHALGQDEAQAGISAFLNKKKPVFR